MEGLFQGQVHGNRQRLVSAGGVWTWRRCFPLVLFTHAPASFTALPAAERFSRRISEYFRERINPSAPAFNAAAVAAYVSSGEALRLFFPTGMPMSIPGRILHLPWTPARAR